MLVASLTVSASAAPTPRALRYACAGELYGAQAVLRYLAAPPGCEGVLVDLGAGTTVLTCQKQPGTPRRGHGKWGIRKRAPVGLLRLMEGPGRCSGAYWDESPVTLPAPKRLLFCAAKKGGELRLVRSMRACDKKEFAVRLPKRARSIAAAGNAAPVAADDSGSTDATRDVSIAVLSNDTDPDGNPLRVGTLDSTGTTGDARLNGDGTITYSPSGRFRSLPSGQTATDRFTYTATDGAAGSAPATVTVTIAGTNDAPVAFDDNGATDEDTPTTIALSGNDKDADGDAPRVVALDLRGTKGTVAIDPGGTAVTYDPAGKFDGLAPGQTTTDTFRYKANDGTADSAQFATVTVTVAGVNDAPVVDASTGSASFATGDPPVPVDPDLELADPDSEIAGATVTITTGYTEVDGDALAFVPQGDITGAYDPLSHTLTLTGTASVADYRAALRSVAYFNTTLLPATDPRTISFQVTDADGAAGNADTRDVTVTGSPPILP